MERNNGKGVFYGVIGVATLVVAIIGATFAYFTASASNNNVIKGNMATVQLSLAVEKVVKLDEVKEGMIPMSNGMVEQALTKNAGNNGNKEGICVDDNGNAVCQVYKITLSNESSAGQFVDGYVSLRYGSGTPTDTALAGIDYVGTAKHINATKTADAATGVGTTMRWAQAFCTEDDNGNVTACSTGGDQILGTATEKVNMGTIGAAAVVEDDTKEVKAQKAHNIANIRDDFELITTTEKEVDDETVQIQGVLKELSIASTTYDVIGTNYIRISNHNWTPDATGKQAYTRGADVSSALVFNNSITAGADVSYYIVVWLSENGENQTAGATVDGVANPAALSFFDGNVTFISAQGSEVSATFSGYSRVSSQPAA